MRYRWWLLLILLYGVNAVQGASIFNPGGSGGGGGSPSGAAGGALAGTYPSPTLVQTNSQLPIKAPVRVASTVNVTLATPGDTHDGVVLAINDRLLLTAQTDATENGIYLYTDAVTAITRTADADSDAEFVPGFLTPVEAGSTGRASLWLFAHTTTPTLGVTPLVFERTGVPDAALPIALLPTSANHGATRTVNDGVNADDCTVGGGSQVHECYWDSVGEVWTITIQGTLTTITGNSDVPGVDLAQTPLFILSQDGESGMRQVWDAFGGSLRIRYLTGGSLGTGTLLPSIPDIFIPCDTELIAEYDNNGVATELGRITIGAAPTCIVTRTGIFALPEHLADTADAHDAAAISSVPAGNLAADDVQEALNELDTEKMAVFTRTWAFCVDVIEAAASHTNVVFPFIAPTGMTVTGVACKLMSGTVVTPPTFTLEDDDGNAMTITDTNPTCAAVGTEAVWKTVTAGNTLVEGEGMRFDITNSPDGNDNYALCVRGSIP